MNISDFSKKYKLTSVDSGIVGKLYQGEDKSEKEWVEILHKKVVFRETPLKSKLKEKIKTQKDNKNNKNKI